MKEEKRDTNGLILIHSLIRVCAGAMENWGLVTYRETFLLVDEKNSSAATKQDVAIVVGHELAHQWFGNLVTMVRLCVIGFYPLRIAFV